MQLRAGRPLPIHTPALPVRNDTTMSITVRIKNGTLIEGESLCRTCRNAHIQKGFRESEETIFCAWWAPPVRPIQFKVAECSDYSNRLVPYRSELEKMALLINIEPTRKPAGFRSGIALANEEEEEEEEESVSSMSS
jgi:hypothetical protein